eukprot:snap_masked-scaffold_35-processed-gene-1.41-mRNA-1 protein AED:1.00 eAED:1.00 QI:0/-1/0/0/-1/1/1/0/1439
MKDKLLWSFLSSLFFGLNPVIGQLDAVSERVDLENVAVIELIIELSPVIIDNPNNAGLDANGFRFLGKRTAIFMEGPLRFGLEFGNIFIEEDENGDPKVGTDAVGAGILNRANRTFAVFNNVVFGDDAGTPVNNLADALEDLNNFPQNNDEFFDDQDEALLNFAALLVVEDTLNHSPSVFCTSDKQCLGARQDNPLFQGVAKRVCEDLDNDNKIPKCNTFVAFFTLRWLGFVFVVVYIVLICWAVYFGYPWLKKRYGKKDGAPRGGKKAQPVFQGEQQVLVNTLAQQCASSENLVFIATDLLKQAKNIQSILAVEARREAKIVILTCEYFQAMAAVLVSLTHQYLHENAWEPQNYKAEDAATRAMQLEVLNYVRNRISLALMADSFTPKSIDRIAEAYVCLRKISENLILVGFSSDLDVDGSLGSLNTPIVELQENAFKLEGQYVPGQTGGTHNGPVQLGINIQNTGVDVISATEYLGQNKREGKDYDPRLGSVTGGKGDFINYTMINGGQEQGMQNLIRTFWGTDIDALKAEAATWLDNDGRMEEWLDIERMDRESRAAPMVRRGEKKKRKKKKKKDKKKDKKKYKDVNETGTEITEFTEASGWSVLSSNTYVYNIKSVVNQGLGIAGKPGIPYEGLGVNEKETGKYFSIWQYYFPNFSEWPKFHCFVFIIMPIIIMIPMLAKARQGAEVIDIDGNVAFKARVAGFGISYLGVPAYYFLDGRVPNLDDLVPVGADEDEIAAATVALDQLPDRDPFGTGEDVVFMSNEFVEEIFPEFDGRANRNPDAFTAEIQAGVLAQANAGELASIRSQQRAQEISTTWVYALMHTAAYFFGIVPISLVRESLEILARRFPFIRSIYPMAQWRELHMNLGLAGIYFVTFGSTVFLITQLVSIGKSTPFAGLAGDPNIPDFFELADNVLYIRQFLLPAVPLLLLMKYASRGPPTPLRKYAPTIITLNYWEICYFLHYATALGAIITLVIYRAQVFYWMGATWGFIWGGNKIIRILRTKRCTIKSTVLIQYKVEDKRNNAKKKTEVLRVTLNVPRSFTSGSRGQACWLTVPHVDYVAHPFTLAKVPSEGDQTIMFHIGVKYLKGDDVIAYARPENPSLGKPQVVADPNALPIGWDSAVDPESGQTYYFNAAENKTQWEKPNSTMANKITGGTRLLTSRFSMDQLRGKHSAKMGLARIESTGIARRGFKASARATWTQKFAQLGDKLNTMDDDTRKNSIKNFPVYVSAPLGTSMDDSLKPSLPGSIIITTQNGLPAGESSVRWLLQQKRKDRPKFHFFVSVSREVNDALSVVETLRDAMCDAVVAGTIDIDGLNPRHAHMADWLSVNINLTRRSAAQIEGDRDMLMRSLNPPAAPVTPRQLEMIETWLKYRVNAGRLDFARFLQRTSQMVKKRTGLTEMAVGYCGSAAVAYSIRSSCRKTPDCSFDGEFI